MTSKKARAESVRMFAEDTDSRAARNRKIAEFFARGWYRLYWREHRRVYGYPRQKTFSRMMAAIKRADAFPEQAV